MSLTTIEWCYYTWNIWRGCRKVCAECANCYITRTVPFRTSGMKHGSERVLSSAANLREPLAWNRKAGEALRRGEISQRPRVFCLSLGDLWDDEVPLDWLRQGLSVIAKCPNLDWMLLTKRPQNIRDRLSALWENADGELQPLLKALLYGGDGEAVQNLWLGVSSGVDPEPVFEIHSGRKFLSCEPMLRPLDEANSPQFDLIIFGGESGDKDQVRPMDLRDLRRGLEFCAENEIPAFVKQLGRRPELRHPKGGDLAEWPEDLRVRQMPGSIQLN